MTEKQKIIIVNLYNGNFLRSFFSSSFNLLKFFEKSLSSDLIPLSLLLSLLPLSSSDDDSNFSFSFNESLE